MNRLEAHLRKNDYYTITPKGLECVLRSMTTQGNAVTYVYERKVSKLKDIVKDTSLKEFNKAVDNDWIERIGAK